RRSRTPRFGHTLMTRQLDTLRWVAFPPVLLLLLFPLPSRAEESGRTPEQAEARALRFLSEEVPRWSRENHCFSCHNNGDAARALYVAVRRGRKLRASVLVDTSKWLSRPPTWNHNGGDGPASDKRLARVEFSAALREAILAGEVREKDALKLAAKSLLEDQSEDGSWPIESGGVIGSPAGYGRPLASALALEVLREAREPQFNMAISKAEDWFESRPVHNTLDAASALLALGHRASKPLQSRCLTYLRTAEVPAGGWGPFPDSAPEPFDTALTIAALSRLDQPESQSLIRRGRRFLAASQRSDGSWRETTRPAGGESYAQRLSTTGWAAWALLETSESER
ncbi:MAG TPA: prenyltransferase/squalene oxidase repeat-containing protein, partial [Isosphaeraceae bacterium]|nr:prenyltransferase/squalene oxidase repeat-containing protein [Isosphaeraceae bacterium]